MSSLSSSSTSALASSASASAANVTTTKENENEKIIIILPIQVIVEHIMPFIKDRKTWNSLSMACREIRQQQQQQQQQQIALFPLTNTNSATTSSTIPLLPPPWPMKRLGISNVQSVTFSPNNMFLAIGCLCNQTQMGRIYIYHVFHGHVTTLDTEDTFHLDLLEWPTMDCLVCSNGTKQVQIWNLFWKNPNNKKNENKNVVDNNNILYARQAFVSSLQQTTKMVKSWNAHEQFRSMAITTTTTTTTNSSSSTMMMIALGHRQGQISIWSLLEGKQLFELNPNREYHITRIQSLRFVHADVDNEHDTNNNSYNHRYHHHHHHGNNNNNNNNKKSRTNLQLISVCNGDLACVWDLKMRSSGNVRYGSGQTNNNTTSTTTAINNDTTNTTTNNANVLLHPIISTQVNTYSLPVEISPTGSHIAVGSMERAVRMSHNGIPTVSEEMSVWLWNLQQQEHQEEQENNEQNGNHDDDDYYHSYKSHVTGGHALPITYISFHDHPIHHDNDIDNNIYHHPTTTATTTTTTATTTTLSSTTAHHHNHHQHNHHSNKTKKNFMMTCSFDKSICIWDLITGKCLTTLTGHEHHAVMAKFSPNGKTIVSQSYDEIRLWSMEY